MFILFAFVVRWLDRHTYLYTCSWGLYWASQAIAKLILSSRDRNCEQHVRARMWAAFFIAALWVTSTDMQPNTPLLVRFGAGGSFATGYIFAWFIPVWFRQCHLREQNHLLERCRVLLMVGVRAFEAGDHVSAKRALQAIHRLEAHWRLGDSIFFKVSIAAWATLWACIVVVVLPLGGICLIHYAWTGKLIAPENLLQELWVATAISLTAPLYALIGYFQAWVNPWAPGNCGERLAIILSGKRSLEAFGDSCKSNFDLDGLTPGEVFGLGVMFTQKELDLARRKLVKALRPDRWHKGDLKVATAREMALKRVNVAYDALREEAS